MSKYALYGRTKYLATKGRRIAWGSFAVAVAALVLPRELWRFSLVGGVPLESLSFFQTMLWLILTVTGVFMICRYASSREYQFFRSLPLPRVLRSYIMGCQLLPVLALSLLGSCVLWSPRQGSPSLAMVQQVLLLLAGCTFLSHGLLAIRAVIGRRPFLRWLAVALLALFVILCVSILDLRPLFSLHGGPYPLIYRQLFTVRWYVLLPCGLWLFYYAVRAPQYETGSMPRRAIRRKRRSKVRGGLYANLLYKDWLVASKNPLILFFYGLSIILTLISLKYRFDGPVNAAVGLLYTFIASTLSEEILKGDMADLSFLHTLPIKQRDFYNRKILSVATVTFIPSEFFLTATALGGAYSLGGFLMILIAGMAYHLSLCAMQCAILMKHRHSPGRAQAQMAFLVLGSFIIPILPAVYLLLMYPKARAAFCGGRS